MVDVRMVALCAGVPDVVGVEVEAVLGVVAAGNGVECVASADDLLVVDGAENVSLTVTVWPLLSVVVTEEKGTTSSDVGADASGTDVVRPERDVVEVVVMLLLRTPRSTEFVSDAVATSDDSESSVVKLLAVLLDTALRRSCHGWKGLPGPRGPASTAAAEARRMGSNICIAGGLGVWCVRQGCVFVCLCACVFLCFCVSVVGCANAVSPKEEYTKRETARRRFKGVLLRRRESAEVQLPRCGCREGVLACYV